jgi:hypothetical protein
MRITQDSLRDLCKEMIALDDEEFNGKTYLSYMQSLKPDSGSNQWVSFKLGKRFTFEPIFNDFGVSEWMDNEKISELCHDTLLNELSVMMGNQYEIITVWKAHYDISYSYFGDEDCELILEFLGELDGEKLHIVVKDFN